MGTMTKLAYGRLRKKVTPHGSWGSKLLPRFKSMNGKKYQLHATKGWRCIENAKMQKGSNQC